MKQGFDAKVPTLLKKTQIWFGNIISQPFAEESCIQPIAPSGKLIEEEAGEYIVPSPTLRPAQRIELYNQQYWWRLLGVLHENYPLVTRLFGYHDFNQLIGIPYLVKFPPNHWSLNELGEKLPEWVEAEYHGKDKKLVYDAALVDHAYIYSFLAKECSGIDLNSQTPEVNISSLADRRLRLQPHVLIIELPYDLFAFRKKFLEQDPDYWVEHEFPELVRFPDPNQGCFILYRDKKCNVTIEKISSNASLVLKQFKKGTTIDELCDWLSSQPEDSSLYKEASENLGGWLQRWVVLLTDQPL
jgi:hypothetical protein